MFIHGLLAFTFAGGCRSAEIVEGLSDSTYVATIAALRRVQQASPDSVRRTRLRDSILQSRGLTAGELERAARVLADDPARAQRLWQAIEQKMSDTSRR